MSYPDNFQGLPDDKPAPSFEDNRFMTPDGWDLGAISNAELSKSMIESAAKIMGAAVFFLHGRKAGKLAEQCAMDVGVDSMGDIHADLEEALEATSA